MIQLLLVLLSAIQFSFFEDGSYRLWVEDTVITGCVPGWICERE